MTQPSLQSELTTRGAVWLLVAICLWTLGLARADGLLTSLMTIALALVPWARWHGRRVLQGLNIEWQMPARAMVDRPLALRGIIHQGRAMAAHNLRLVLFFPSNQQHELTCDYLAGGDSTVIEESFQPLRRGVQDSLPYQILSTFPWGWWQHCLSGHQAQRLRVIPAVRSSSPLLAMGLSHEQRAASHLLQTQADGEWRGLREWRAGDALKRLHLAASTRSLARGQGLMVSDHDHPATAPNHVVVLFHSFASDRALIRDEPFERALSVLVGTLRYLLAQQVPASLVADFDAWCESPCMKSSDFQELLDRFACVKRAAQTEWHDWQEAQRSIDPTAQLWMISDMPPHTWQRGILPRKAPVQILDISKKPRAFSLPPRTR
jgi:uncharacterized protein (DUF58 family)